MSTEASVIVGHRFANIAEDYEEKELWEKAADAHSKAAEHFEIALNDAADVETIKTLNLLTANHRRKGNDLNRKIQRMKAAALQKISQLSSRNNSMTLMGSNGGLRNALPEKKYNQNSGHLVSRFFNKSEYLSSEDGLRRADGIGESYAVLSNDDDNDDTFNKFLETVDILLQGLINPAVAFTTTPLNKDDVPVQNDVQISDDEPSVQTSNNSNNMMESFYMVHIPKEYGGSRSIVFPTIKKVNSSRNTKERTKEFYLHENEKLKKQITLLVKRAKALEHSAEEGNTLKNSILQFRNNVHQQAKRIMQSHNEYSMRASATLHNTIANSATVNPPRYPVMLGTGNNGNELVNRLKELEEENRQLKIQNEKQKMIVNKYKEKWDMLKENAKKRRAQAQKVTDEEQEE